VAASESRKQKRALDGRAKPALKPELPAPMGAEQLRGMVLRLLIPVVGAWIVFGVLSSFMSSPTLKIVMISIPVIVSVLAAALVIWVTRQAKKAQGVASILSKVESAEDRKAALAELEATYKKGDPTAVFAKAQLEMQDDPKKALKTLEQIDLNKVLAPIADETRAQRAMIHLTLGDVGLARQLVDNIDLGRHKEAKTRAMLTAVCAEAWARSGSAKKGLETLSLIDPEDAEYEKLQPQLYRAYAFVYAHTNDIKGVRRVLKRLAANDVRLLGGFMMKKTHPLLQKEAKKAAEQSGQMPRKMVVQRRF
jgi:uncharacterized membrane protein YeaQ/YmgE (transglycosylase-associated protein family)